MAARLAEMEVRTLSDKLAVLDANAPVGMLTKGPAKVGKNTLDDIFFPMWRLTRWSRYCLDK